ncbi:MAG: peptide-methionine (S)-S-oxide reductase, partial [Terriglobales bacterium]
QYRSVIFCFSPEQEQLARQAMAARQSSGKYARPIVTEIQPAGLFYRAEEYHQQYLGKRGLTSCHV